MSDKISKNKIDLISVGIYLLLVVLGWINIYSSAYDGSSFEFGSRYGKQMIMIGMTFVILLILLFVDVNIIFSSSYFAYGFVLLALIAVLFLGDKTGGSRSWFEIGSFKLQPAEFAKLATALALSRFLGKENFNFTSDLKSFVSVLGIVFFPAFLILLQGDLGSAMVFSSFIFVLYRQGLSFYWFPIILIGILVFVSFFFLNIVLIFIFLIVIGLVTYRYITGNIREAVIGAILLVIMILIGLAIIIFFRANIKVHIIIAVSVFIVSLIVVVKSFKEMILKSLIVPVLLLFYIGSLYSTGYIFENILKSHHRARINVLFGLEKDLTDIGYNVHQSKIAIGSGGLSGKGYLKGTQTKYDFVPEQDTDFIFCTVGEEWGFVGTAFVIIVFTVLLFRILFLAERQRSVYSRVFGYSLAGVLFFHYSVNIAMTIGLFPVIGIPLPFFSYGGSSLFAFSMFLFIFLRLDSQHNTLYT